MKNTVDIISVVRKSDKKMFRIGDTATSDGGIFRGVIDGLNQFKDDFRAHLRTDEESEDREYFSISELD